MATTTKRASAGTESTAVTTTKNQAMTALEEQQRALAIMGAEFEQEADGGYEETDRDSYAIPFIKILQKMSPEVDEESGQYVEGARPGMFYNSATGKLADGKTGIIIIPVHFRRRFLHWADREMGGGYKGDYSVTEAEQMKRGTIRGKSGRDEFGDGTYLADTREHYVMWVDDDDSQLGVISMSSTQIKKSKKWLNQMDAVRLTNSKGIKYRPPSWARLWRATSVAEKNDQGSWYGWVLEPFAWEDNPARFQVCKQMHNAITSGELKREDPVFDNVQAASESPSNYDVDDSDLAF